MVDQKDSISKTKTSSQVQNHSAFSKLSRKSSISETVVKNAMRNAFLHAEMSTFERQQSIAEES